MIRRYTVSDFYGTFETSLKLIAGAGGMTRTITDAGILDYEIDPVMKDKYFHTNFQDGQFIVTTFSVARDNPYLILDAVKYLIAKGASGLVIKNVFHLPIHESVVRYADSKNFPIFLAESQDVYVERVIYEIYKNLFLLDTLKEAEKAGDRILSGELDGDGIAAAARKINPSAAEQYYSIFARRDELAEGGSVEEAYDAFSRSEFALPENTFLPHGNGFFLVLSDKCRDAGRIARDLILRNDGSVICGISDRHSSLREFDLCLKESIYAALLPEEPESVTFYSEIGSYQLILPFAGRPEMMRYRAKVLDPVLDHDIENNSSLMKTLSTYLDMDCDLNRAAEVLSQHRNTIRYRLDKITALTGLDYRSFSDLEQLSLAEKIERAARLQHDRRRY